MAINRNTLAVQQNTDSRQRLEVLLEKLLERLRNLPDPGPIKLVIVSEEGGVMKFKVTLPEWPPEPNDIENGKLSVSVAGAEPSLHETAEGQTEVVDLVGNQGDRVLVEFVYVDDAGNPSTKPSKLDVVLADTIPPPDPGQLGLVVTEE